MSLTNVFRWVSQGHLGFGYRMVIQILWTRFSPWNHKANFLNQTLTVVSIVANFIRKYTVTFTNFKGCVCRKTVRNGRDLEMWFMSCMAIVLGYYFFLGSSSVGSSKPYSAGSILEKRNQNGSELRFYRDMSKPANLKNCT